jgi:large subunit ribosomal protein L13
VRRRVCVRTYSTKPSEVQRAWHVVDADGMVLGRLATEVARILRGKHKPTFSRHIDTGDHVVVINASKVVMTADKASKKLSYHHSGYPGGLTSTTFTELLATRPADVVRAAVKGMVPRGPLGRAQLKKLKVYAGADHPHAAQRPVPLDIPGARRAQ